MNEQQQASVDSLYFEWRQGSVIPESFVRSKGWLDSENLPYFAVVVTHDCDCVADSDREPSLEVILGTFVNAADGSVTNAKSTRRLHLAWIDISTNQEQIVEFVAKPKTALSKAELAGIGPSKTYTISRENIRILVRWLRSRYDRATFPDEFINRLKPIQERIERAAKSSNVASALHGIYFYHDPEGEIADPEEPYDLQIVVLYDSSKPNSEEIAKSVAKIIAEAFERKYKILETASLGLQWSMIELHSCEPVSDEDFSFSDLLSYKLYRLDHISLRQDPQIPIPDAA